MTVARKRKAEEVEDILEVDFVAPQLDYVSVDDAVSSWSLDPAIAEKLKKDQIVHFFPVQSAVVPVLLRMNARDCIRSRDVCVAAPTGSGKTLAYAVPILQTLFRRKVVRLRALVLLPSRELVSQVYRVFSALAAGMDIKVGVATGQNLFQDEQAMLSPMHAAFSDKYQRHLLPARAEDEWPLGSSSVDILISTPGRLVDHLQFTKGFTLEHLRYLVLDEADRLLGNASDHWLRTLVQHIGTTSPHRSVSTGAFFQQPQVFRHSVQLLLFSATLTDNPRKLALLGIQSPLVVKMGRSAAVAEDGDDRNIQIERSGAATTAFVLPEKLKEMVCTVDAARKPIVLYSMLEDRMQESLRNKTTTLIFASSVETTHRLCRMLQLMNGQDDAEGDKERSSYPLGGLVKEMSSHINSDDRSAVLTEAAAGRVSVIVSSDNLARGIDLPNIALVVNYDPPKHARTYVHRVGRTARANRDGLTVTFLKVGQMGEFNKMRGTIGGGSAEKDGIKKYKPSAEALDGLESRFRAAIHALQLVVSDEDAGQLPFGADLPVRFSINS
jgi:ATP-dependent RNA helicase DDX51/DBP6